MFTEAIARGVDFLLKKQSSDGAWRDFSMHPGESDSWVTAYIGLCLSSLRQKLNDIRLEQSCFRASQWLLESDKEDGGWAYNGNTPCDSDSTAHAVLFLHSFRGSVPNRCYHRLLSFQREDGGFATFEPRNSEDSWGISHPDVTPVVMMALLTWLSPTHPTIQQGIRYIMSQLQRSGLWHSFWWASPLYSTLANVNLLERAAIPYDRAQVLEAVSRTPVHQDPFHWALLGEIIATLETTNLYAMRIGQALERWQRSEGSWKNFPMLRVTIRRFRAPWVEEGYTGEVISDPKRLFTTATVLQCLASIDASWPAGKTPADQDRGTSKH
jgi:squalene cyclase